MAEMSDCVPDSPYQRAGAAALVSQDAPAAETAHIRTWRLTVSPGGNGLVSPASSTHSLPIDSSRYSALDPGAPLCSQHAAGDALELPTISLDTFSSTFQDAALPGTCSPYPPAVAAAAQLPVQRRARSTADPSPGAEPLSSQGSCDISSLSAVLPVLAPRHTLDPAVLARLPAAVARRLSRGDVHDALLEAVRRAAPQELSEKGLQQADCLAGAEGAPPPPHACEPPAGEWDSSLHWDSTEAQPSSTVTVRCAHEALISTMKGEELSPFAVTPASFSTGGGGPRGGALPSAPRRTGGGVDTCSEKRLAEALRRAQLQRVHNTLAERARQRSSAAPRARSGGRKRSGPLTAQNGATTAAATAAASQMRPSGLASHRHAPRSGGSQRMSRIEPSPEGGGQLTAAEQQGIQEAGPGRRAAGGARGGRRLSAAGVEMYRRALQATTTKETRIQEERRAQEAAALMHCTFSPRVNLRPGGADTARSLVRAPGAALAARAAAQAQAPPKPPAEALERTSSLVSPLASPDVGPLPSPGAAGSSLPGNAEGQAAVVGQLQHSGASKQASARFGSGRAPAACSVHDRLYAAALASRRRHSAAVRKVQEERQALQAALPGARPPSSRTLGNQQRPRRQSWLTAAPGGGTMHRPAFLGAEQCTFAPRTNLRRARPATARGEGSKPRQLGDQHASPRARDERRPRRPVSAPQQRQQQQEPPATPVSLALQNGTDSAGTGVGGPSHEAEADAAAPAPALAQLAPADEAAAESAPDASADFSWGDFLQRQQRFLTVKEGKAAQEAAHQQQPGILALAPGSRRILEQQASSAARRAAAAELAASLEDAALMGLLNLGASSPPAAHSDRATAPGAEKVSRPKQAQATNKDWRSFLKRSEAGRLRHELRLEDMRARAEAEQERELTFQPHINADPRAHALISLETPELYLAVVMSKQQQRQLQHEHNVRKAEEEELAQCTFAPQVTKLPAYISRMARSYASRQAGGQDDGIKALHPPRPSWQ